MSGDASNHREDRIAASEYFVLEAVMCRRCGVFYAFRVAGCCPVCQDAADHLTPHPLVILNDEDDVARNALVPLLAKESRKQGCV
jgi:hypothetical protein